MSRGCFVRMLDEASEDTGELKTNTKGELNMEIRYDNTLRDELLNKEEALSQSEINDLLRAISSKETSLKTKNAVVLDEIDDVSNPSTRNMHVCKIPELGIEIELMNSDRADKEEKDVSIMGKISRTTDSLHNIQNDTYREENEEYRNFNRKWYSEMHHSSLGEHAVIKLWFNGIDIATAKLLEKGIFGISPTERSTRYFIEYAKKVDESLSYENLYNVVKELYIIHPSMDWNTGIHTAEVKNKYYEYLRKATNTFIEVKDAASEYMDRIFCGNKVKSRYLDIARQYLLTSSRTSVVITYNAVSLKNVLINLARGTEVQRTIAISLYNMLMGYFPSLFCDLRLERYMKLEKNIIANLLLNRADDDEEYFLKMGRFNPNLGFIAKDLTNPKLWEKIKPIITSRKPAFNVKKVNLFEEVDMNDCLNLMDLYSVSPEFIASDMEYFRGLQYPVRVIADCQIDYGTWRDIQRHRISNNIYNDYNTPLLGIYGHNDIDIHTPNYMIPNIEILDAFTEKGIIHNHYNDNRDTYLSNKSLFENVLSEKLRNMVDSYYELMKYLAGVLNEHFDYNGYDSNSVTIYNNIQMVELSSDLNLLAYRITTIMNLDLRAIKHIVENRIISAGHNNYRLFAMSMFENTIHYVIPKLVEKKMLTYENKDRFVRTLFVKVFNMDYYKNIIDSVKNI